MEHLTAASLARSEASATSAPGQAPSGSTSAATSATTSTQGDDLVALLKALSAVYDANPQLWLDPDLRYFNP